MPRTQIHRASPGTVPASSPKSQAPPAPTWALAQVGHSFQAIRFSSPPPIQGVFSDKVVKQSNLPALDYSLYARALKHHSDPEVRKQYAHLEKTFAERHDAVDETDHHRLKTHDDLNTELTRNLAQLAQTHDIHKHLYRERFPHQGAVQPPAHTGDSGMDPKTAARFAEIAKLRGETIAFRELGELNPMHLASGFVPKPRHVHAKSQDPAKGDLYTGLVFAHHDLAKDPPKGVKQHEVEQDWKDSMSKGFATTATLGELLGQSGRPATPQLPAVSGVEVLEKEFKETQAPFEDRYQDHEGIRQRMGGFRDRLRERHPRLPDSEFADKLKSLHDKRVFIDRTTGMPFAGDADLLSAGSTPLDEDSHKKIYGLAAEEPSHFYDAYGTGDHMHGQYGTIRRGTMGTAMDLNIGAMETLGIEHELVKHGMEPHNPHPEELKAAWFIDPEEVAPGFAGEHLGADSREVHAKIFDTHEHHGAEWGKGWMPELKEQLETMGAVLPDHTTWQGKHPSVDADPQVGQGGASVTPSIPPIPRPPKRTPESEASLEQTKARLQARNEALRSHSSAPRTEARRQPTASSDPRAVLLPPRRGQGAPVSNERGRALYAAWQKKQLPQERAKFSAVSAGQRGIFGSSPPLAEVPRGRSVPAHPRKDTKRR